MMSGDISTSLFQRQRQAAKFRDNSLGIRFIASIEPGLCGTVLQKFDGK